MHFIVVIISIPVRIDKRGGVVHTLPLTLYKIFHCNNRLHFLTWFLICVIPYTSVVILSKPKKTVAYRLNFFIFENDLIKSKLAEKIGINQFVFYEVLNGRRRLPVKYWKKTIRITRGYISLAHLLREYMDGPEVVTIKETTDPTRCEVSIDIEP